MHLLLECTVVTPVNWRATGKTFELSCPGLILCQRGSTDRPDIRSSVLRPNLGEVDTNLEVLPVSNIRVTVIM